VDPIVATCLSGLELGQPQGFGNLAVFPLFTSLDVGPKYVTLSEALGEGVLEVTELHESGSVPELKIANRGKRRVLLLDGEELVGAKQNRVLNTTILLKKRSETIIPVSCTEQGRWSYVSKRFAASGVVMSPRMRGSKSEAVAASLERAQSFRADQGQVWAEIEEMSASAQVRSSTHAMRDVFESKTGELEEYLGAFPCLPNQKGLLAIVRGKVVGLDFVSRESSYRSVHAKLARSYALDALLERREDGGKPPLSQAKAFLEQASQTREKKYKSVGHGWDHRFQGDNLVGSALTYRNTVIHMAFFSSTASERQERIARARRRREFRGSLEQRQVPMQEAFLGPEQAVTEEDMEMGLQDLEQTE